MILTGVFSIFAKLGRHGTIPGLSSLKFFLCVQSEIQLLDGLDYLPTTYITSECTLIANTALPITDSFLF